MQMQDKIGRELEKLKKNRIMVNMGENRTMVNMGENRTMVDIELIKVEDMGSGGRGRKKGTTIGKYITYRSALGPHIGWFKDQINKSKDGNIRIKAEDIKKILSEEGIGSKHNTTIYWGIKFGLWEDGNIVVTQGKHRNGDDLFIMRMKKEGDVLPSSLAKSSKDGMNGVGKTEIDPDLDDSLDDSGPDLDDSEIESEDNE